MRKIILQQRSSVDLFPHRLVQREGQYNPHAPTKIGIESTSRGWTLVPSTSMIVIWWLSIEKVKLGSQEMETKRKR